jgi:flagellar biosynthesis chaperone FliJ
MSKELKDFIDSVDSANKAQVDLEITIRGLKEDVQRLNFTIDEQKRIIEDQKSKLSSVQNDNTPEDISVLKELVTQQRQDIIKKDKDVEILQLTIAEITEELENVQKFEEENEELIYANKEIVQLTEENENFRSKVEELNNTLTNLQKELELDDDKEAPGEESSDLLDAKKLIIKLTEEKGINRVQIEASKLEIENLIKQNQENEALKNQVSLELVETNKILDQLTYDNDQYHEKVNFLQQKLEEIVKLQEELPKDDKDSKEIEVLNMILVELERENNDLKSLVDTKISIIKNLKLNTPGMEKELGEKPTSENQKISDLQDKVYERDEELNALTLKLQKFENSNLQLSDLIVELKVQQDQRSENIEFESSSKKVVYEDLPPNLFFKMYRLLSENNKTTVVNQLIDDLNSETRDFRTYAIKVLSVIKGNRVFEVLKDIINDDDWIVKLYLIKAFRNFNEADTIPLLTKLLEDKDIDVREAAISMLSDIKQS